MEEEMLHKDKLVSTRLRSVATIKFKAASHPKKEVKQDRVLLQHLICLLCVTGNIIWIYEVSKSLHFAFYAKSLLFLQMCKFDTIMTLFH